MAEQDFYSILGVSKNATAEELKRAYRQQALQWHPDKHAGEAKKAAEEKFKKVNQAYEVLKDPQKRQMYDQMGHSAYAQGGSGGGSPFGGAYGQQGPFRYSYSTNVNMEDLFGGYSDPFDIFEQFFGGGSRQQQARKPVYTIELDFMEAVKGIEKNVSISGQSRTIKIPGGVDDNTRIRFSEFDIIVRVRPHSHFKRQGQDLIVDVSISFPTAALGGTISVPTIEGDVTLKVRAGTQSGTLVRLRGKGIPYPRSSSRGDAYIRLTIEVPKSLSRKQKELLKEFEAA